MLRLVVKKFKAIILQIPNGLKNILNVWNKSKLVARLKTIKLNIVNVSILTKLIYGTKAIPL